MLFRTNPRILLPAAVLVLGCGGVLGARLATAGAEQTEFPARPTPELCRARAVMPAPARPAQALPGSTPAWLRRTSHTPTMAPAATDGIPDFAAIRDVNTKKVRFFAYLLPLVERENARLSDLRERLGYIHDHRRWDRELDAEDAAWLDDLAREFRLKNVDPQSDTFWDDLMRRVDVLPDDLVLVQAANESAWGTSRFAREGHNFFGQWCFSAGCGIVPAARPDGATYEVAHFTSVDESVGSYMRNLNSGHSYTELRRIRADFRAKNHEPEAAALAGGLLSYSERGQHYVDEIRAMLRHNASAIEEARSRVAVAASS